MALGLTKSVSNRTRRSLPSRFAVSILSDVLSTQNSLLRETSIARPSGLVTAEKDYIILCYVILYYIN